MNLLRADDTARDLAIGMRAVVAAQSHDVGPGFRRGLGEYAFDVQLLGAHGVPTGASARVVITVTLPGP